MNCITPFKSPDINFENIEELKEDRLILSFTTSDFYMQYNNCPFYRFSVSRPKDNKDKGRYRLIAEHRMLDGGGYFDEEGNDLYHNRIVGYLEKDIPELPEFKGIICGVDF